MSSHRRNPRLKYFDRVTQEMRFEEFPEELVGVLTAAEIIDPIQRNLYALKTADWPLDYQLIGAFESVVRAYREAQKVS